MPNQQDFTLNLIASLDEGSVQSDAARMASTIARTIEQSFEGLGQKIAENIMRGVQTGVQTSSSLVDPYGRPAAGPPQPPIVPPAGGAPVGAAPLPPTPAVPSLQGFRGGFEYPGYLDIHAAPASAASSIRGQIQRDILGGGGGGHGGNVGFESDPMALATDVAYQRARQIRAMREAGMNVNLTDEERGVLSSAQQAGQASLEQTRGHSLKLSQEIERLNKSVIDLQQAMNRSTEMTEKESLKKDQDEARQRRDILRGQLGQLSTAASAESGRIKEISDILGTGRGGQVDFARALGGISAVAMGAARLPGAIRAGEVGFAGTENLEARAAMGGDIERLMAVERLGGMGHLRRAGMAEALGLAGATALGSVGSFLSTPLTGGFGAMAGAGLGISAVGQFASLGAGQQKAIDERIQAEMSKNMELYQFSRMGRQTFGAGFGAARELGAPEMANFLMGGRGVGFAEQRLETERLRAQVEGEGFRLEIDPQTGERRTRLANPGEGRMANVAGATRALESARAGAIEGMSPLDYAASLGIAPGQAQTTFANLARGMGGQFFGQQNQLQNPRLLQNVLQMQAAGLSNAGDLSGMLMQGATPNQANRAETVQVLKDTFEDAVSAGMDRTRVAGFLQMIASSSQGLGSAGAFQVRAGQTLGVAQRVFGAGGIEGPEAQFAAQTLMQTEELGRSGGGLMEMGGVMATQKFLRGQGVKASATQVMDVLQNARSPQDVKRLWQQHFGKNISDQEAQGLYANLSQQIRGGALGAVERASGGDQAILNLGLGGALGTHGAEENFRAQELLHVDRAGVLAPITTERVEAAGGGFRKRFTAAEEAKRAVESPEAQVFVKEQQVISQQVTAGLATLGSNLKEVNQAFEKLIERAEKVIGAQPGTFGLPGASHAIGTARTKGKPPGH